MYYIFHFFFQDALNLIALCLGRLDNQLIVDLQKQAGLQLFLAQALPDMDHRQLDDVGGRALDRRVAGHPLPAGAHLKVGAGKLRQGAAAAKQRFHVAFLLGVGNAVLHVAVHLGEGVKVSLQESVCLFH